MKKLINKDNKLRFCVYYNEKKHFILKLIFKNSNFFTLIRWSALVKLELFIRNNSKISTVNRCLLTINKKRFNKLTVFSRHVFLKLIQEGFLINIKKSSW